MACTRKKDDKQIDKWLKSGCYLHLYLSPGSLMSGHIDIEWPYVGYLQEESYTWSRSGNKVVSIITKSEESLFCELLKIGVTLACTKKNDDEERRNVTDGQLVEIRPVSLPRSQSWQFEVICRRSSRVILRP